MANKLFSEHTVAKRNAVSRQLLNPQQREIISALKKAQNAKGVAPVDVLLEYDGRSYRHLEGDFFKYVRMNGDDYGGVKVLNPR